MDYKEKIIWNLHINKKISNTFVAIVEELPKTDATLTVVEGRKYLTTVGINSVVNYEEFLHTLHSYIDIYIYPEMMKIRC